ncbi:VOC family protein [Hymenobacter sp. HD11105]
MFHGMFEGNILTFNPGWDADAQNLAHFTDVRALQKELKSKNMTLTAEADEQALGPAAVMLTDPDGNVILLDQHR